MSFTRPFVIAAAAFASVAAAHAGSYPAGCTSEPQSAWTNIQNAEAKAKAAGYTVAKSKVSGSCHEVYASKDAQRYELFYNPTSGALIHSRAK